VGEVHPEEISKAPVPLVKHFEFVFKRKLNHLQGIISVSMMNRNVERQFV